VTLTGKDITADLSNATVTTTKNFTVTAGGEGTLTVTGGGSMTVGGDLLVSAVKNADVTIDNTLAEKTQVTGSMTVTGGTNIDHVIATPALKVGKNLTLNLKGGDNEINLGSAGTPLNIGGLLKISALGGADTVDLTGIKVATTTSVNLGLGGDTLSILDGSVFTGAATFDLGVGDDILNVANNAAPAEKVSFNALAKFLMGVGNDTAKFGLSNGAGGDPTNEATFGVANNILDLGIGTNVFTTADSRVSGPAGALSVLDKGKKIATLP
jgi:hypothetical protein